MYLDFFRERVIDKVTSLPLDALIVSVVPTDWTALELVKHLTFVEMRWLEWGYEGTPVEEAWGDHLGDRWFVGPEDTLESLTEALRVRGAVTREIVRRHDRDGKVTIPPPWSEFSFISFRSTPDTSATSTSTPNWSKDRTANSESAVDAIDASGDRKNI